MSDRIQYRGFEIDNRHNIFFNGKPVFTAYWQRCFNLDECKRMIDISIDAKLEQLRKGNYAQAIKILTDDTDRSDEAREQEADRFEEKMNAYYEREQLNDL